MVIELRQQLKLTQQLIMTPQLQMAIKLLQLSRLELMDKISQELEENPALEEVQDVITSEEQPEKPETSAEEAPSEKEVTIEEKIPDEIDWSNYLDEYNSPGRVNFESEGKDSPRFDAFISKKESLTDHLLWQFLMTFPSAEEERIGSLIIGNLNKDGYLDATLEYIVENSGCELETVENVLAILQTFDPIGICSRDLGECLLIQAKHLGLEDDLLTEIITDHLAHLENKNYKAICRALKVRLEDVIAVVNVIKSLEPRPGRQFSEEEPQYITPDIHVYKSEGDFIIVLNDDGMPKLRVNQFYKKAISKGETVSEDTKEYLQEKLRSAAWLIRSIHQRQKTIYKVMESILKFQRAFFEHGITQLKPMVLRDVAEDISMHESTISRVTTNKYAYTPQGIFELKYFFNSSIKRVHGEAIASASVQEKIKKIIENENPQKPYSDSKMAEMLKTENINIARRTVAKYREMLGVLSSNKRKQL
ncbi:MAG: RNA polymerase factor sigma-54 [Deltaproteobacteria bacterium]|nr:RNA polymerase factor sigma-54 [Deltaproteobacteria bacterium]MBW2298565.1 RNA polymerase factor sigma-54 [Deltaproteobacteria bacterium]MBW2612448.1 RNA polymerase factor sigma-54 [Deltaproteobacteria bacterium]MBW2634556.1 RNA polymerase factor sigma-54 [Deltaproteobacteria bacterium]